MDDEKLKKLFAELIEAQGVALGLIVAAMSRQLDAQRLVDDLRAQIDAAKLTNLVSPLAIRLATYALAAADAETASRSQDKH